MQLVLTVSAGRVQQPQHALFATPTTSWTLWTMPVTTVSQSASPPLNLFRTISIDHQTTCMINYRFTVKFLEKVNQLHKCNLFLALLYKYYLFLVLLYTMMLNLKYHVLFSIKQCVLTVRDQMQRDLLLAQVTFKPHTSESYKKRSLRAFSQQVLALPLGHCLEGIHWFQLHYSHQAVLLPAGMVRSISKFKWVPDALQAAMVVAIFTLGINTENSMNWLE